MIAKVDIKKCTGCGACVDVCPVNAIRIESKKAFVTGKCFGCGACESQCPWGAIIVS
jgi:electron transfer flavoprotein alpha subunit